MREKLRLDYRIAGAWTSLLQWVLYAGLVFAAIALMMLGRANPAMMERVRVYVSDAFVPISDIMSRPVDATVRLTRTIQAWSALKEENAALREERDKLLRWQDAARHLEAENAQLRQLLHFVPDPQARFVSARVIADSGGAFARSLVVGAGTEDGVGKGQAVLTGAGLIGRIAGVAPRSSRVLLITDLNFRAPVAVGASRIRAILIGDNSDQPKITHIGPDTTVAVGDRVVTSGHADAFPADLPIGVVASVRDGTIKVQLLAHGLPVDYVQIVDYGLAGIIGAAVASDSGIATRPKQRAAAP